MVAKQASNKDLPAHINCGRLKWFERGVPFAGERKHMGLRGVPVVTWPEFVSDLQSTGAEIERLVRQGEWVDSSVRDRAVTVGRDRATFSRWVKALDATQWRLCDQLPISACGDRLGVTRQRAGQLLDMVAPHLAQSVANEGSCATQSVVGFVRTVDHMISNPGASPDDVARYAGVSTEGLPDLLGALMGLLVVVSTRQVSEEWLDEQILEVLRRASADRGGALSRAAYAAWRQSVDERTPSHALVAKRFGSWARALDRAGVSFNAASQGYSWAATRQDALRDMVDFIVETGKTSVAAYDAWSAGSPGRIRVPHAILDEHKTWSAAVRQAFAAIASGARFDEYREKVSSLALDQAERLGATLGVDVKGALVTGCSGLTCQDNILVGGGDE